MRTHSCVGINPFLPTPAAANCSRLPVNSIDNERPTLILPLAFSEGLGGVSLIVGDMGGVGCADSFPGITFLEIDSGSASTESVP